MANTKVDLDDNNGLSKETYLDALLERGPSVDSILEAAQWQQCNGASAPL